MSIATVAATAYPEGRPAVGTPESRGLERDEVRLLAIGPKQLRHTRFRELAHFLRPGDLVVVNTSATLPAAVDAVRPGERPAVLHFSTDLGDGTWVVELRRRDNTGPYLDGRTGEVVVPAGGGRVQVVSAYRGVEGRSRLLRARPDLGMPVYEYLGRFGRPIAYGYLEQQAPLSDYQTIFAGEPGSAEMPSAGRPFSGRVVAGLVARGVVLAPVVLHTGVSSPEMGEPPAAERFRVPATTAELVNATRRAGGRVVAVGTTVTRALESAANGEGLVEPAEGWTDLVLDGSRPARVVGGLITGWHAASATHLMLLESVAGREMVSRAYDGAVQTGYLWHEFGDSCLLLP